jgi:hypothetical protein
MVVVRTSAGLTQGSSGAAHDLGVDALAPGVIEEPPLDVVGDVYRLHARVRVSEERLDECPVPRFVET